MPVDDSTLLDVVLDPYVSRAAHKLIHALDELNSVQTRRCVQDPSSPVPPSPVCPSQVPWSQVPSFQVPSSHAGSSQASSSSSSSFAQAHRRVETDSSSEASPQVVEHRSATKQQTLSPLVIEGAGVLDAGASTGGFTQVLLARGAAKVYALDVGHGQLAPVVRQDPRVVVREGLNLRDLSLADVEGVPVDLVVADVSFISLTLLLAPLFSVLAQHGSAFFLVKPQFEVGRSALDSHGVVRDDATRARGIAAVVEAAADLGWPLAWQGDSALPGERGNREAFCLFQRP
ncbi:MAG: hypothetical protein LBN10_12150 [Propionibacteriaceae bacterium]|nr:hypothetical protein [Propionibacteriaceae bacterium]